MRVVRCWGWLRGVECAVLAVLVVGLATTAAQAAPFVYVTDAGSGGAGSGAVSQYNAKGGALTALTPPMVSTGSDPVEVAVGRDGRSVYVTTPEQPAAVLQYSVGPGGALTLESSAPLPAISLPNGLSVSPDGDSVYVINVAGDGSVLQYSVGADGALIPKSPPAVPTRPGSTEIAISPDGRNAYVTNSVTGENTVSQYTVGLDGTLQVKSPPTVPTGDGPVGVAVSPDGRSVYVANSVGAFGLPGMVSQYTVGPGGALTPKSPSTVLAGRDPNKVAVSPDGRSLYVTNSERTGTVLQYTIGVTGMLTPKTPAAVAAGTFPGGIAISSDGQSLYAANAGDDTLSQYSVGTDGRLSARSPATVATGNNPLDIDITPAARPPTSINQCLHGGFAQFGFKNVGQCVRFVVLTRVCGILQRHGIKPEFCPPQPPRRP